MTKPVSQQRIRQVAIVLNCVDASTKQRLLGQLPPDQARLVRQEIARLGDVDPQEREQAMKAFQSRTAGVLQSTPSVNRVNPIPRRGLSPSTAGRWSNSNGGTDYVDEELEQSNPASTLLDNGHETVHDHLDIDYKSVDGTRQGIDDFQPVRTNSSDAFVAHLGMKGFPPSSGAEIAKLLCDERPTVIATVIKQVSRELGAAILAALPSRVAALALSTLPSLDAVDEAIMNDIQQSLREKLSSYRSQLSPDAPGVQHIQSLLRSVPESQRKMVEQDLIRENLSLANSLGLSIYANSLRSETRLAPEDSDLSATKVKATPVEISVESNDHSDAMLTFDDLVDLPAESLALVLRAADPDTILVSVTGAAVQMRARLETMIDPRNLFRLRIKLQSLTNVAPDARFAARREITDKANELLRAGKISAPKTAYRQLVA